MRPTICSLSAAAMTCFAVPLTAQGSFAHPAPLATAVRVTRNVSYTTSDTALRLDVYQPTRAATARPVLIFSARDRARDQWPTSWARHATSRGIVSVIPDMPRRTSTGDALDRVVAHLHANARRYGIDTARIVLFAGSAGVDGFLPAVEDSARSGIRAAIMFYGTANLTSFRRDLPLLVVRAGLDHPEMNAGIDRMLALAIAQNAPVTVINHHTGRHNFELVDDDVATRQILDQTLAFVEHATEPSYQALLGARRLDAVAAGLLATGDYHAAAAAYATLAAQRPSDGLLRFRYATALAGDAQYDAACRVYRETATNYMAVMPGARACVRAGHVDSTMAWLARMPKGWVQADEFRADSTLAPLVSRADFQALIRSR